MSNPIDLVLGKLDGYKLKSAGGKGNWVACCPSHEDKRPSLAISEKEDGRILLHCRAGCASLDVVYALGLDMKDLFPKPIADHKGLPRLSRPFSMAQAFELARYDALFLAACHNFLQEGKPLEPDTYAELQKSAERIELAWGIYDR